MIFLMSMNKEHDITTFPFNHVYQPLLTYINLNIEIKCFLPGIKWECVPGVLKQVESGAGGLVFGVNKKHKVVFRVGITRARPKGRTWRRIRGRMSHITIGCTGAYALNPFGQIFKYTGKMT